MDTPSGDEPHEGPAVLLIDEDVIVRTAIASYLRECGYQVVESDRESDGKKMLEMRTDAIDIAICAASGFNSSEHFEFVKWARANHPRVRILIAASVDKTAKLASEICEEGPHLRKPYEHQALIDWIKRLRR